MPAPTGSGSSPRPTSPGLKEFYEAQCRAARTRARNHSVSRPGRSDSGFRRRRRRRGVGRAGAAPVARRDDGGVLPAPRRFGREHHPRRQRRGAARGERPVPHLHARRGDRLHARRAAAAAAPALRWRCHPRWRGRTSSVPRPPPRGLTTSKETCSCALVVWSTGGVGSIAIDAIRRRPDLELVGVWVHSPDKVGKDAGELAGGEPMGVAATNDADALIALAPDCVVYAASGPERDGGRRARLPAAAGGRHQRRVDVVDEPGVPAVVLRPGLARPTGGGGQGRRRVVLRVGHLSRLRLRSARAAHDDAVEEHPHASRPARSRSTTTTRWPT